MYIILTSILFYCIMLNYILLCYIMLNDIIYGICMYIYICMCIHYINIYIYRYYSSGWAAHSASHVRLHQAGAAYQIV